MPTAQKRDSHGHFIKSDHAAKPAMAEKKEPEDTLVSVKVANPLRTSTKLLNRLKTQKTFKFRLRSSFGVFVVALLIAFIGVHAGGKVFCSRSTQTHIGFLKILGYKQSERFAFLDRVPFLSSYVTLPKTPTAVLIDNQSHAIHLISKNGVDFSTFANVAVFATGKYNSCSQTLKIYSPSAIEKVQ